MMNFKNKIIRLLIVISTIIVIDFISAGTALSANNAEIIIDDNLKPGMALKDAVELLGPPEKIKISDTGTIVIPYDILGLSIEVISGETVIDKINITRSFKGRVAFGIESGKVPNNEAVKYMEVTQEIPEEVQNEVQKEVREEMNEDLRQELLEEVKKELREEVLEEVNKEVTEEFDVFDLYGIQVKQRGKGVIISEIRPGSVAEKGGLKTGAPVRKAFYDGTGRLNIYSVSGLEKILRRSILKRKKTINILADKNYYYKVEVPKMQ